MTYEEAKQVKAKLENTVARCGAVMQEFPKNAMGLTPDDVKASTDFQIAKRQFDGAFRNLQQFNAKFVKVFKKEYAVERRAKH